MHCPVGISDRATTAHHVVHMRTTDSKTPVGWAGVGALGVRGRWACGDVRECRAWARAVRCRAWAGAVWCSGHGHPQRSRHGIGFHTRFRGIDRYCKHHRVAVLWWGRGGCGEHGALACVGHRPSQRSAHVDPQPARPQRGVISTIATRGAARRCMHRGDRISTKVFGLNTFIHRDECSK